MNETIKQYMKKAYLVYTERRNAAGIPPYVFWGKSARGVSQQWKRRYGELPVKVESTMWDINSGNWISDPENPDVWEG